jgi:hypothetical protein
LHTYPGPYIPDLDSSIERARDELLATQESHCGH